MKMPPEEGYTPTNRDKARASRRSRMRVTGRGLITVNNALEQKRERERRAKEEDLDRQD